MKIMFICGSLQSGQDGVGDYTRRLGVALLKKGHQIRILALNDWYCSDVVNEFQNEEDLNIEVLRIPNNTSNKIRLKLATEWLHKTAPDFISLQYVAFAFHPKGISFSIIFFLKVLGKGRKWHIMFHELWVGMEKASNIKIFCWGRVQKWLTKRLILTLKPSIIHTQAQLYQLQLQRAGFTVFHLPLFSNIPFVYNSSVSEKNLSIRTGNSMITLLLFGGIHPDAPVHAFANEAYLFACKYKRQVRLTIIGRSGGGQSEWQREWVSAGLSITIAGEQSSENISVIMQNASYGISTTPIALSEKSGSVAAMKEHGLPVICVSKSIEFRECFYYPKPEGIFEYKTGNLEEIFNSKKIVGTASTSANIADLFLKQINSISDTH